MLNLKSGEMHLKEKSASLILAARRWREIKAEFGKADDWNMTLPAAHQTRSQSERSIISVSLRYA